MRVISVGRDHVNTHNQVIMIILNTYLSVHVHLSQTYIPVQIQQLPQSGSPNNRIIIIITIIITHDMHVLKKITNKKWLQKNFKFLIQKE